MGLCWQHYFIINLQQLLTLFLLHLITALFSTLLLYNFSVELASFAQSETSLHLIFILITEGQLHRAGICFTLYTDF